MRTTLPAGASLRSFALQVTYRARKGTCLFLCPFTSGTKPLTPEDFSAMFRELLDKDEVVNKEEIRVKKKQIHSAVSVVAMGAVDMLMSCWECEVSHSMLQRYVLHRTQQQISGTRRPQPLQNRLECQSAAWNSGHPIDYHLASLVFVEGDCYPPLKSKSDGSRSIHVFFLPQFDPRFNTVSKIERQCTYDTYS